MTSFAKTHTHTHIYKYSHKKHNDNKQNNKINDKRLMLFRDSSISVR